MENPTPMLSVVQIQAILQFLSRTQLAGAEAMVLVDCVRALEQMLEAIR